MSTYDPERRRWWCHVAERLGVVADVHEDGRPSPLHRLARRHVEHCAYCRAEREEWARMRHQLRALERPPAPDALLDGVMARIALERSQHRRSPSQAGYTATHGTNRAATTIWLRVARGVMAAAGAAALGLGAVGSSVVGRSVAGSVSPVSMPVPELADAVRAVVLETFHSVNAAALQAGPGGQLLAGLIWGLTGLAVAVAVATAAETATNDK